MKEPNRPLFQDLQETIAALAADAGSMLALRWQLARLELRQDADAFRRLAIRGFIAGALGLTALPLLATAAALALVHWTGLPLSAWLVLFGISFLAGAAAIGCLAWRRFRREFTGLTETLEELREDAIWLREGHQAN